VVLVIGDTHPEVEGLGSEEGREKSATVVTLQ